MNSTVDFSRSRHPRFYYGWVIVGISFLSMGFHNAARFSFSIFQVPLIEEYGWRRGDLGGAFALMLGVYIVSGPLFGSLFDKKGPRAIMPWGSVLIGGAMFLGFFIDALWHIYILTGIFVGAGMAMSGFGLHGALMPLWFRRKRGKATGIFLAGGGVGLFVFIPAIQWLITHAGWRYAYLIFGGTLLLIMVPLYYFFLRNRPEDVGQNIDGLPENEESPDDTSVERPSMAAVFRNVRGDRRFLALAFIVFFIGLNNNTIFSQLQLFFVDARYSEATGALLLGGIGLVRMAGSYVIGWISDILGRPRTQALSALLSAMGLVILLTLPAMGASLWMGFVFVLVYGFGIGGMSTCHSAMSADNFGGRDFGVIMAFLEIWFGLGGVIGPPLAGYAFDLVGSYTVPFIVIIIGLLSISLTCVFMFPAEDHGKNR